MIHRRDALAHSPALRGLYVGAVAFAGLAVLTVGWNMWEHRAGIVHWLKL